ncbi:hypothetical protein [Thalassospira aquimaris]|uniref:CopG family transcriptional regulator n=1 Tax=Thalassospira aquimaris TaxID=3037796 RepID=A0ABT6GGK4_9PROT|nr:hypothetical protein [Thalassospira sp. FZY0004]MDG4721176.1 hypothetical protein [Thalassospira sp. FZY0004]
MSNTATVPVTFELSYEEAAYINQNMARIAPKGCASIGDVALSCVREMIASDMEAHNIEAAARQVGA